MESLYYNLSEEEFSRSRKILLWVFSALFFAAGLWVILLHVAFGKKESVPIALSLAPFGISLLVGSIAFISTMKRKDQYFSLDDQKLEFRFGILVPKKYSINWAEVNELVIPHKQKKALLNFKDGSSFIIDLTWLQKKKSNLIRKHIYQAAWEKQIAISKVMYLGK
ncbi:MAG TPA: hypothetical protein VK207_05840 [Bacteroidales bacterium]|nr:hypothetical protein [Bacteroidales bacterium]